jgi:hypothetical protein
MRILKVEDEAYDLDKIPDIIDDLRYGILDYSDPKSVDYYFIPLVFLETFYAPAAVLQVGKYHINVPLDWSIVICDPEAGEPEVINIMSLNDRGFTAFTFNPLSGYMPNYEELAVQNVHADVKWYAPKLKFGHLLCVPLREGKNPPCVLLVKEAKKIPEVLDLGEIW